MTTRSLHIDGSFLAYSRFKAHPNGVAARFISKLQHLQLSYGPAVTFVAWDTPSGAMRRRQLHPDYKKGRQEKEPAFWDVMRELRDRLQRQQVTQVQSKTGEADDVIATLVRTTPGPHLVYSADKDMLQLVGPDCRMLKAAVNRRQGADMMVDAKSILTDRFKLGTTWIEGLDGRGWGNLLALAGDSSDHIPGIKGIGPSYALRLLQACPRLVELVLAGRDEAVQSAVAATDPRMVKYALRCCALREELRVSRALVDLQTLDDVEVC